MNFKIHLLLLVISSIKLASCSYENVKLVSNGYEGVVVAINPNVEEDANIIESLKKIWTEASKSLYIATKERAYFRNITILVPSTWTAGTYQKSGKASYEKADVLVADAHPGHGNEPYTLHFGLCGGHGEYIHLTPDYVVNDSYIESWGPKGKVMVHEWAHLRWGVFDETGGNGYPEFYYKDGKIEANRSPVSLQGKLVHLSKDENGTVVSSDCEIDLQTGLPYEGECQFVPNNNQTNVTTSMMSMQYLDNVIHFCHNNKSDPENMCNKDAPNEHNRLCSQRSVWDVILSSDDFNGLKPTAVQNLQPTFNVVQSKQSNQFVLVIDTSGSMAGQNLNRDETKMKNAIQAADTFIKTYASMDSYVGIVDFDSYARVNSDLFQLSNDIDRYNLSSLLPVDSDANGGTKIYLGVDKAIEMIENSTYPNGSQIICLTDGRGSWRSTTGQSVLDKGIVFHTIFFGVNEGNEFLIKLSDETRGHWTFANSLEGLNIFFERISQDDSGRNEGKNFQVKSESISLDSRIYTGNVFIDSTIGNNTVFGFSYSGSYPPYIRLIDPSGNRYCSNNRLLAACDSLTLGIVDETFKSITFKIPGIAEVGTWTYLLTPRSSTTVTVSVSSMASSSSVDPISVKSSISSSSRNSSEPIILYAQVTQGFKPVVNAIVTAIVSFPNGSQTEVRLFDRGATPDTRKNDGIYSRYFFNYITTGRYSMKIKVSGKGSLVSNRTTGISAAYKHGVVADNGTLELNPNLEPTNENFATVDARDLDDFERTESIGGFEYSGPDLANASDSFPPSKVIDLTAHQVDVDDVTKGIKLKFTAPGDDFDVGQASRYEIRYTYNDTSSLINNFTYEKEILPVNVIYGDLNNPTKAGNIENFTITLNDLPKSENITKIGFALRTMDDSGNEAEISNVAVLDLFLVSPKIIHETIENTTNPVSDIEDERFLMKNLALFTNFLADIYLQFCALPEIYLNLPPAFVIDAAKSKLSDETAEHK